MTCKFGNMFWKEDSPGVLEEPGKVKLLTFSI